MRNPFKRQPAPDASIAIWVDGELVGMVDLAPHTASQDLQITLSHHIEGDAGAVVDIPTPVRLALTRTS